MKLHKILQKIELCKSEATNTALDLAFADVIDVPEQLQELQHLQYLDLTGNSLQTLPEQISRLSQLVILLIYFHLADDIATTTPWRQFIPNYRIKHF